MARSSCPSYLKSSRASLFLTLLCKPNFMRRNSRKWKFRLFHYFCSIFSKLIFLVLTVGNQKSHSTIHGPRSRPCFLTRGSKRVQLWGAQKPLQNRFWTFPNPLARPVASANRQKLVVVNAERAVAMSMIRCKITFERLLPVEFFAGSVRPRKEA